MDDMIEKVARAICASMHDEFNQWGELDSEEKDAFMGGARAAIEAMRQPTAFMADSGDEIFRSILAPRYYTIPVWRSMIDAALKERT